MEIDRGISEGMKYALIMSAFCVHTQRYIQIYAYEHSSAGITRAAR